MDMIKKRAAMRGQSGFTLVELLVAVAILAILAGTAVFAVGSLTDNATT
ncbi:MAG: type II secretion system protein, partial [Microthrixaceae bacterium]